MYGCSKPLFVSCHLITFGRPSTPYDIVRAIQSMAQTGGASSMISLAAQQLTPTRHHANPSCSVPTYHTHRSAEYHLEVRNVVMSGWWSASILRTTELFGWVLKWLERTVPQSQSIHLRLTDLPWRWWQYINRNIETNNILYGTLSQKAVMWLPSQFDYWRSLSALYTLS